MAAILDAAMAAGAWGLSTSFFDEDRRGRKVPSRHADDIEFDVLLDVLAARRRGFVEFVPDLLGTDPEVGMHRLAVALRQARASRSRGPASPPPRRACRTGSSSPAGTAREGMQVWPQLSPRTVDFRVNWDSSMMFMSMAEGWHRVVQADGAEAKAALLARSTVARHRARASGTRSTGRCSRTPASSASGSWRRATPTTRSGSASRWPTSSPRAAVTRRTCSPTSCWPTTAHRASSPSGSRTPTRTRWLAGCSTTTCSSARRTRAPTCRCSARRATRPCSSPATCATGATSRSNGRSTSSPAGRPTRSGSTTAACSTEGTAADLVVFALDELHWDDDVFVADLPGRVQAVPPARGWLPCHRRRRRARAGARRAHRRAAGPGARRQRLTADTP